MWLHSKTGRRRISEKCSIFPRGRSTYAWIETEICDVARRTQITFQVRKIALIRTLLSQLKLIDYYLFLGITPLVVDEELNKNSIMLQHSLYIRIWFQRRWVDSGNHQKPQDYSTRRALAFTALAKVFRNVCILMIIKNNNQEFQSPHSNGSTKSTLSQRRQQASLVREVVIPGKYIRKLFD